MCAHAIINHYISLIRTQMYSQRLYSFKFKFFVSIFIINMNKFAIESKTGKSYRCKFFLKF